MPPVINYIPEQDRLLFLRCKELNRQISYCEARMDKDDPATLASLKKISLSALPPPEQRRVAVAIARLEQEASELAALQAELNSLIPAAEKAAERLANPKIRTFVRLHCIDGWRMCDIVDRLPSGKSMSHRYARLLKTPSVGAESEDVNDNHADDKGGSGGR